MIVVCVHITCGSVDRQSFFSCIAIGYLLYLRPSHLLQSNTTDQCGFNSVLRLNSIELLTISLGVAAAVLLTRGAWRGLRE